MIDTLLAKGFTVFAQVMVKIQPIWDRYKVLILLTLGIIIGWFVLGWGLFPVKWVDATPGHLYIDYKAYYLAQVAEAYNRTGDVQIARERLGLDLPKTRNIPWKANPNALSDDIEAAINGAGRFGIEEQVPALQRLQQDLPQIREAPPATEQPQEETGGLGSIVKALAAVLFVLLLLGGAGYGIWHFVIQRQDEAGESELVSVKTPGAEPEPGRAPGAVGEAEPPVKSFTTTYVLGDDYFDPSFSIEIGPDFLGECGIGISETLGAGDPKKVTAFEAWLFDKSDIRTVTTVLASEYAIDDPDLRSKLEPKGEAIEELAPGKEITLETTALRVKARIQELEYAQGNLPEHSFIQKISFELQAWVKQVESSEFEGI
jgi:hypothetical protein